MNISDKIKERRAMYRRVFTSKEGREVLKDLGEFCKAKESTFVYGDAEASIYQEGIKATFLHILAVLNHTDEEINDLIYKSFNVREK